MDKLRVRGFSLVQLMVTLGLFSMVIAGAHKLIINQAKLSRSSSEFFEVTWLVDEIRSILSDRSNCTETLRGKNLEADKLDFIRIKSQEKTEKIINVYGVWKKTKKFYGQGNLKLTNLSIDGSDPEFGIESGNVFLNLDFELPKASVGKTRIKRKILLYVVRDQHKKIKECHSTALKSLQSDSGGHWVGVRNTQNIYLPEGGLSLGVNQGSARFNVKGEVKIGYVRGVGLCNNSHTGTLRFNTSTGNLEGCFKDQKWRPLVENEAIDFKNPQMFNLNTSSKYSQTTSKHFKFCMISESSLSRGTCSLTPRNTRIGLGSQWEMRLNSEIGKNLSCKIKCYN